MSSIVHLNPSEHKVQVIDSDWSRSSFKKIYKESIFFYSYPLVWPLSPKEKLAKM